jgi:long-chain acyl-CoA synthetase
MTFLEIIFERLQKAANAPVMHEVRDGKMISVTGSELLAMVQQARQFLVAAGLIKGDRFALLAPNSIRWTALDLAILAEGLIVVPLYARQAPAELVGMMKDAVPARICCFDAPTVAEIQKLWPNAPEISLLDDMFAAGTGVSAPPLSHADTDPVTIIYTSGTSGEPKGVVLTAGNVGHVVACTNARLDDLMGRRREPDRVFHYLYFCFAGSLILLFSALSRNSVLMLSTDLAKLEDEMKLATPDYFLNVPMLLERIRAKTEETVRNRGRFAATVFTRAQQGCVRRHNRNSRAVDSLWLALANWMIFPTIRKAIGPNLKALICGSAPLALETQLFFLMIGIPVLQAYGLTETTAICTMDDPKRAGPGRVGSAIPGVEMTLAENGEILVRGPNIFAGYWQRNAETEKAVEGGWFHTGDQGEVDASGNWRISGRLKNLIILNSGHNIAPEPLEEALIQRLPQVQQVMLVGNQRSFLAALVVTDSAKSANGDGIQSAVDSLNLSLPHYKQIHAFCTVPVPFSVENGLMTTNGKFRRDAIAARFAGEVAQLYKKRPT